jgi:PAS domain S-box-containing protein
MGDMHGQAKTDHAQNRLGEGISFDRDFPGYLIDVLHTLIDNLPDAIYIKDRKSRFVLCNRQVLRRKAVGSLEEIVGRTDFDFYPPDVAEGVYADEQDLMRTGWPMTTEERCVIDKTTGEPTWNLTTKVPLRNAAGEVVGLVGIGRDITERKRAEEAYHAIVDHSLQGLVIIQNMRIVFANQAMARISGYSVEEMLTLSAQMLRDFIHPLDREIVWQNHSARLKGESPAEQYEFRVIRKDGIVRWLQIHTSSVEYQGQPAIQAAFVDTTERRRAEEALRRSEARNQALLNANPDLMFRLSRGGVFLDCKPPKDDAVSVSPSQFIGKHLEEVFPAAITRRMLQHIQQAIETDQVQTLEYSLPDEEGEGADFECRLVACAQQEVLAIVRDVSQAKRAKRELLRRLRFEELITRLSTEFANLPSAEIDDRIERWLARIGEFLGIDRGTIVQFPGGDATVTHTWAAPGLKGADPELAQENFEWAIDRMRDGDVIAYSRIEEAPPEAWREKEYCLREGMKSVVALPLEAAGSMLGIMAFSSVRTQRDWSNELIQRLRLVGQVFANALLRRRAEQALLASEQNYREIFNAANDAIFIHDPGTGAILDVNRTMLELFGCTYEQALRLPVTEGSANEPPHSQPEAQAWIRKAMAEGPQLFEWRARRANGEIFWVEVNLKIARIGDERRVLAVVRDISERKKAEAQAQQHLAELTRAWNANMLGEMAAGLAHELNQPLCAIANYANGCLRLTRREGYSLETVQDSIRQIAVQAERAADILKRIRGLIAKRKPHRTALDLDRILADAVQMLREEAVKHNVTIVSRLQTNLPKIEGDGVEIEQVVLNLMRNAIEAMNDAQIVHRHLTVSICRSDRCTVEVAVADTGRGLSPELAERIFDSFFTTKPRGLGIGLSLSRRIIEAHRGRLWVESDGRSGATFRFTLPIEGDAHGER